MARLKASTRPYCGPGSSTISDLQRILNGEDVRMVTFAVPSFSAEELHQSIEELGWGLMSWEILPETFCGPNESRAKLELLEEGDSAIVSVSNAGWKICIRSVADISRMPTDNGAQDAQSFETLEALLAYLSPAFESRRMKLLTDKLENISVRRSWNEGSGDEADDGQVGEELEKKDA